MNRTSAASSSIINENAGVNRVIHHITGKPLEMIEWE
jgi:GMP synthase PP-ATPase subunit